ncbi:MAG: hypothetical protein CTY34_01740 [Methylobacter sp.]|nr:MAG: hypothetical protein CTY34_01740 [Methylobacter sp.]PPD36733.1 MAG: hypothetical protein CTY18_02820 [Methylomonas sp.]
MNATERERVLAQIINQHIEASAKPSYQSYLKTKLYGYEKINRYFNGRDVLELGSDESGTSSVLVRWSENLTIVDKQDKFFRQIETDAALSAATFIQANWEDYRPERRFSDIIMTDSLEHVVDPVPLLKTVSTWLAEDGRIHIIVPNAQSVHRLLGVQMGMLASPYELNANDLSSGHLRVYDMQSLSRDLNNAGLAMEVFEGIQFKPLTDSQLAEFSNAFHRAMNALSVHFNEYCAEIYACCYKN